MVRIIIENLILLLLPTILYVAYIYLTGGFDRGQRRTLDDAPFIWLFLAGVALVLCVVVIFGTLEGGQPGHAYRPPEFRDGKIVPGKVQEKPRPGDG